MVKKNSVTALRETLTTTQWMMNPDALHASRDLLIQAIGLHQSMSEVGVIGHELVDMGEHMPDDGQEHEPKMEQCINVEYVDGDILRNSGMCAIGSMDLKEHMEQMTDEGVLGHVIVINSGGGSAQAVYDFEDMVRYAHEAGQPVIAFVRGAACSAAYYLAMLCDRVLTYSEHDLVGSIGCMVAGFWTKPDETNQYTLQTYREVYADRSTMKNHAWREAEQGNMQPFLDECNRLADLFAGRAKECRPNVTEEQLTGEHYDAIQTLGTLVDECGVPFSRALEVCQDIREDMRIASLRAGTTIK